MKIFSLLLFTINLNLIISYTLGKYEKTTLTSESITFDSYSFFIGDEMEFKFKTDNTCEDLIYYGYHDNHDKLTQFYKDQTPYSTFSRKKEIKTEDNINYDIKYFTIKKKPTELHGFYGKYLLIKYNCSGSVEIENINPNLSTGAILGIIIGCVFVIVIIIVLIIHFCKIKKNEISNENVIEIRNTSKIKIVNENQNLNNNMDEKKDVLNLINNEIDNNNNKINQNTIDNSEEDQKSDKRKIIKNENK